ncbi:UNVERIFIED_CONTAM: two-component system sensor histidine kinase YesM [Acetivibrio alkalicellulosi]
MKVKKDFIRSWFYNKKLKEKIRVLFLVLVMTHIATFFLTYYFIKKNMLDYMLDSNYNTMISIGNNLNVEFEAVDTMSKLIMTNSNVLKYLRANEYGKFISSHDAIMAMYEISNMFNHVSSIYIFKNKRDYIHISNQITYINTDLIFSSDWQDEIIKNKGLYVIRVNGDGAFEKRSGDLVISFIRIINDIDTQMPIGIIAINLNDNILEKTYKDMVSTDRNFGYFDDNKSLLIGNYEFEKLIEIDMLNDEYKQFIKQDIGSATIASYYNISGMPFVLAQTGRITFLKYFSDQAIGVSLIFIILSIVCLCVIGVFLFVYIAKPIDILMQYVDIVKKGWTKKNTKNEYLTSKKIKELSISKSTLIEVNEIINELINKEREMQKAELEILQEQINPHFLYNTLGTIADLALQLSNDKLYDAVETLGNFYRKFLSKGSKEVSIEEEVSIVKDYLKLQKLRYSEVFEDEYDIDEDLLGIKVPKLILQPLVENSLYHGIRLKGEKGTIKISIYSKDNKMYIVVFDTGIGMSKQQINQIMKEDDKKSFGFKRTIERIRYYYNEEDVFEIVSQEGAYCKVIIKVPL